MKVTIHLFAMLKEALGETVELELPEPATVRGLLERFGTAYPQFRAALPSLSVAVDHTYARGEEPIAPGQEVAIFPPVSGG
jgi:molybdopterin converting factor subunit 1